MHSKLVNRHSPNVFHRLLLKNQLTFVVLADNVTLMDWTERRFKELPFWDQVVQTNSPWLKLKYSHTRQRLFFTILHNLLSLTSSYQFSKQRSIGILTLFYQNAWFWKFPVITYDTDAADYLTWSSFYCDVIVCRSSAACNNNLVRYYKFKCQPVHRKYFKHAFIIPVVTFLSTLYFMRTWHWFQVFFFLPCCPTLSQKHEKLLAWGCEHSWTSSKVKDCI